MPNHKLSKYFYLQLVSVVSYIMTLHFQGQTVGYG
jgi:hypothetical protein